MFEARVTIAQRDHRKIVGYLRRQFEAERRYEFEAQKADTTYDVDPFTRGAYRRMLELELDIVTSACSAPPQVARSPMYRGSPTAGPAATVPAHYDRARETSHAYTLMSQTPNFLTK